MTTKADECYHQLRTVGGSDIPTGREIKGRMSWRGLGGRAGGAPHIGRLLAIKSTLTEVANKEEGKRRRMRRTVRLGPLAGSEGVGRWSVSVGLGLAGLAAGSRRLWGLSGLLGPLGAVAIGGVARVRLATEVEL